MVKSTVRFPEGVVEEIEALVEEGHFESKSEFYRFATDHMLELVLDEYDPETIDYEQIKSEVLPETPQQDIEEATELPFFESLILVRKYALRGNIADAEDFIDHHYQASDRHALILEEILEQYRPVEEQTEQSEPSMPRSERRR